MGSTPRARRSARPPDRGDSPIARVGRRDPHRDGGRRRSGRDARGALTAEDVKKRIHDLVEIPRLVEQALELDTSIAALARHLSHATDFLYLGRGVQFPIALEGALKLKEISYIHAEGYAGGEMKHGPIALIDGALPVLALMPSDDNRERTLSNLQEAAAREARIIGFVDEGERALDDVARGVVELPVVDRRLAPILYAVPLQLFAYHVAVLRGAVPTEDEASMLARAAARVSGIWAVDSHLDIGLAAGETRPSEGRSIDEARPSLRQFVELGLHAGGEFGHQGIDFRSAVALGFIESKVVVTGAQGLIPERAEPYTVRSEWRLVDGDWKLSDLRWE